ncbi:protein YkpC [Metabacillus lacus]|uniref:protein YkpC n=1 Tax=Metabacillus lacus TaxID=1983721 RepID=UPI001FEAFB2B|nr:protein YkpC [Metabacillus lacus]
MCDTYSTGGHTVLKDLGRRFIISLALTGIILGGMSISLAHMPAAPPKEIAKLTRE